MRRHVRVLTLLGVTAIGLTAFAGCGDTTADEPAASAECAPGAGATVTVEIPEFMFEPTPVQINACDSVVWKNTHDQAHTSTGKGDKAWSTGNITAGTESDPVLFEETGSFAYICALHPFMKGTVEVA
jgi:plastocyanin